MAIIDEDKNKNGELVVNGNTIKGVNEETQTKATSSFQASDTVTGAKNEQASALSGYKDIASKDSIVSQDTWESIDSSFKKPNSVKQADKYLSRQLETIQSGKTSMTDQIRGLMSRIMGREKFSYDVDSDPLFQQALASSMSAGKQAMQDTIGQASALTGGYGSTYATQAGNQTYNSFIEDAYDNLPQYYQMALDAYNAEGDELYRQYNMLASEDDKEFNRNLSAFDTTFSFRNQRYNEAYSQFRDEKSDAFASANLQISEHGQLSSDAYNYYNATSNYAESLYAQEFDKWNAEVNQAMQWAGMQNTDYWNQANQDFTATENQKDRDFTKSEREASQTWESNENALDRTHQSNENALDRTHQSNENALDRTHQSDENALDRTHQSNENALDRSHDTAENQAQRDWQSAETQKERDAEAAAAQAQRDWQSSESQKDRDWQTAENEKDRAARGGSGGGSGGGGGFSYGGYTLTADEMDEASQSKNVSDFNASILTPQEFARRGKSATIGNKNQQFDNYEQYIEAVADDWYKNDDKHRTLSDNQYAYVLWYHLAEK